MKIPGADAAKNVYGAFNLGFNLRPSMPHLGSFSGVMSAGGLIGAGAAVGAFAGSQVEGDMTGTGAIIGAAAGAAALPALGLTTRIGYEAGKRALPALGSAVMKAPAVGFAAAKGGINLARHARSPVLPNTGKAFAGFASMMVDWDSTKVGKEFLDSVKMTGPFSGARAGAKAGMSMKEGATAFKEAKGFLGKTGAIGRYAAGNKATQTIAGSIFNGKNILWGSSIVAGAAGAFNEMNRAHMGQMDGQITRSAPRVPSYMGNAGATGDLVFALNANRRG